MSNRRVKSLAYDDDDFDDYDEFDEEPEYDQSQDISVEDREQLRLGTIEVRKVLDPQLQVSDTEIQDALWNFYYDVAKTVTFIKGNHKPKAATKPSQPQEIPTPIKSFFSDCPWGRIPEHRKSNILIEPLPYPRGLLGGALKEGKMSKLAALAAKRRQKEAAAAIAPAESTSEPITDDYAASLSKLALSSERPRNRKAEPPKSEDVQMKDEPQAVDPEVSTKAAATSEDEPVVARTTPSAFAGTFLNSSDDAPEYKVDPELVTYGQPSFDFNKPSPDDIVYKAQTGRDR